MPGETAAPKASTRALIVQKFGGTSLATPRLINRAADRVKSVRDEGYDVVIVASAMGNMTDHLINLAKRTVSRPPQREMDMLITAGERVSMSLLAMALQEKGVPAISFTGSQSGIITTSEHSEARILEIRPSRILAALEKNHVVIIAGFQGVSRDREITSLGRGGSDTTAVALAAALKAERCDVLTDVDGVYTGDPRRIPKARLIESMDYRTAIEFASLGAKMHARSLELARRYKVPVRVASNWGSATSGTWIGEASTEQTAKKDASMENTEIRGIGTKGGQTFLAIEGTLTTLAPLFVQAQVPLTCFAASNKTVALVGDTARIAALKLLLREKQIAHQNETEVVVVSLVGNGICGASAVLADALSIVEKMGSECLVSGMNSHHIQFAVPSTQADNLARALHRHFIEPHEALQNVEPTKPLESSVAPPAH